MCDIPCVRVQVRVLLEAGAPPLSQDHKGRRSAAMYALAGNQADDDACIQVLKQVRACLQ